MGWSAARKVLMDDNDCALWPKQTVSIITVNCKCVNLFLLCLVLAGLDVVGEKGEENSPIQRRVIDTKLAQSMLLEQKPASS